MKTPILTALTLIVLTTTAHASAGQWAREASRAVARQASLIEYDSASLYANICGHLETNYLMYDRKNGDTYTFRMSEMPSMESGDKNGMAKVRLVNIADCSVRIVKVRISDF